MEIRKAATDDIGNLIALRMEFLREEHPGLTNGQTAAHRATLEDYFSRHLNRDCWGYFAMEDTDIAAVVYLVVTERPANPRFASGKLGTILNVYTRPAYRRRGMASALLRQALADARELGVSVAELQATETGRKVYEKLGFTVRQSSYTSMEYRLNP